MRVNPDDDTAAVVSPFTRADHRFGLLAFEPVTQDGRTYYALTINGRKTGSLTTAKAAYETIAYWKDKGWIA